MRFARLSELCVEPLMAHARWWSCKRLSEIHRGEEYVDLTRSFGFFCVHKVLSSLHKYLNEPLRSDGLYFSGA